MKKISRTISGVTPVAVMARPQGCPGNCLYCPDYAGTPRSYTPESPAVLRAIRCDYDPIRQVELRLKILTDMGHPTDKIELIVMGGTFLAQDEAYQREFIKGCYDGLNGMVAASLAEAKRTNETAAHRATGLCIETRPDWCGPEAVKRMLEFGATRVELGVQTLSDDIYRLVGRGHAVADVVRATRLLKEHAFKVYYHWMPGLPGLTPADDLALFKRLFAEADFKPDGLKIYPTVVVEGTGLERWLREGRYRPYDQAVLDDLLADMKAGVPPYVRIARVLRDIPAKYITDGCRESLRDQVKQRMSARGQQCHCIRCREYGHRRRDRYTVGEPEMKRLDYEASGGHEIFLSYEDAGGTIFGLLRLRIQPEPKAGLPEPLGGKTALVRELHVFGLEVPLAKRSARATQHKGLGRGLLAEAERIAGSEFGMASIAVISGTGAREYYRGGLGYGLVGDYMVKELSG